MKRTLLLSLLFFSLLSCEEVFECILGLEPQINETSINQATINEPYFQVITAEVKNDAFDDGYDYFFDVIGELPEGIELIFFYRRIEIVGTPVESGRFNFTVYLSVESFEDGYVDPSPTCNEEVSKTFTLMVNEQ